MLPKNPSKNKHSSSCISSDDNGTEAIHHHKHTINPSEIPSVLPSDQFFTMLKEHQSSIINLETKLKTVTNKSKANRCLADELDLLKTELDKKQNADTEIYLRNELNKQEREIKRLRDELNYQRESTIKSKYKGSDGEKTKELTDIKDQIVSLTNLVK